MLDDTLQTFLGDAVRSHLLLAIVMLFGSTLALPLLVGVAAAELRTTKTQVLVLLLGLVAALVASVALQQLGGRPRPESVLEFWPAPPTPSCPSGHAAVAAAVAYAWSRAAPAHRRRTVFAVVSALFIGLSRVALGHHHPSDVVLGWILGLGLGAAAWGLLAVDRRPARRWGSLLWAQVSLVVVLSGMAWLGALPYDLLIRPGTDKVLHTLLFGLVAFFGALLFGGHPAALGVPFALASLEEAAQALSPLRTADLGDLGCDLAGMVAFTLLARWLTRPIQPATRCSGS